MNGLIDRFRKLLLALGYAREEIDKYIIGVVEQAHTFMDGDPF